MVAIVLITAVLALILNYSSGMNDAANCIASVVATKALPAKAAVAWAALWIFLAYFVFDMTVATTMGKGIVFEGCIDVYVTLAALLGSIIWVAFCTKFGLPISTSHALIGGLIGPVAFVYGSKFLVMSGILTIVAFIFISPALGLLMGFGLNCILMAIFKKCKSKHADKLFRRLQLVSSAAFSLGHGGNDAQKTMGIVAVLLASAFASEPDSPVLAFLYGNGAAAAAEAGHTGFYVPVWLQLVCYGLISIGTITGGWKVIRTLGDGLSKIYPVQGFCAETSGAVTLILTALSGIPVSTTHIITGSIIGTGITRGVKRVKWLTAKNIVWAWVLTIPAVVVISGLIYLAMVRWFGAPVKVF